MIVMKEQISDENAEFWDELCGSGLARTLGITDSSIESLAKFDNWYFDFYPYLPRHIPFDLLSGKDVLEVGLGYGSVSQRIAESGANYSGLDIALGPVKMANHRLSQLNLPGRAYQGSILNPQFDQESFDYVIAIGCLHHTGDLKLAIERCRELLRSGGKLIFMVYYAYSYRRFKMVPMTTLKSLFRELCGYRGVVGQSGASERAAYDTNAGGAAAPHTDWISARSLSSYCEHFTGLTMKVENLDENFLVSGSRSRLIGTKLPSLMGLDLYATATK